MANEDKTADNTEWDVIVVGSGNGGMTAAITAKLLGHNLRVLVIEKSDKYGGTSALSGGGVWIPNNLYAKAAGAQDSPADAREYLRQTIPAGDVPDFLLDTYIAQAPKMLELLHDNTRVRYISLDHYPDYYTDRPGAKTGHRSLEPETVAHSELGDEAEFLQLNHQMMYLFDRIGITQVEAQVLMSRSPGWIKVMTGMLWDYWKDVAWWRKHKRGRRLTCGSAGVARLRLSMMDLGIPLWRNTALQELVTEGDRVTGVQVLQNGQQKILRASKGVILAAGGFENNQQMREQYLPQPTNTQWSAAHKGNTGDAIRAAQKLGAATRLMDGAWWCTTLKVPGEALPRLSIMEKSMPGCVVVNPQGERISNESQNYMAYQKEFFAKHTTENPCYPAWMVFDNTFRSRYIVGPIFNKAMQPDWALPKDFLGEQFLQRGNTLQELAQKIGVNAEGLTKTVARFNGFAKTGVDEELQRGASVYDRYYGDPSVTPNPCLAPLDQSPFYAVRLDPGDFGTQGGMATNEHAQVLREDGSAIAGLYATGNCSAAILPTYPGPGSTLGPAMTFGYLAAKHICGK
ncbi:MAG TPA: FAD-dependent oxidoreductase [Pseudomonadales bacterium]|nr:FAD-dependent oxidoreductase [Pseudomonadales bacterium]